MARLPTKASVLFTLVLCAGIIVVFIFPSKSNIYPKFITNDIDLFSPEDIIFPPENNLADNQSKLDQDVVNEAEVTKLDMDFDEGIDIEDVDLDDDNDDFDIDIDPSIFSTTMSSISDTTSPRSTEEVARKNVLFIMTDDMRPQLGSYKGEDFPAPYNNEMKMFTPNLDRLADRSILFKRAYVQYSLCGPSRTSMLTSRRPDMTRIFGNNNYWRNAGGNFTTLPQYFKNNGYASIGIGKIFHKGRSSDKNDKKYSWSQRYYMPPYTDYHYLPQDDGAGWKSVDAKEREKVPLSDEYSIIKAKEHLKKLGAKAKAGKQPFFLAVGFKKPHLSLVCPEEYFHMYPLETGETYLPDKEWQTPAVKDTVELGGDSDDPDIDSDSTIKVIPDDALRHMRRAYFACISYVDHMVGKLVDELDILGLSDSTIVTFVADHGYHLGENAHWGKVTTYERANHIPMMIHIPGVTDSGIQTRSLVEAVDLFPTLVEAAGIPKLPKCPIDSKLIPTCTDGKSMIPLIKDPTYHHKKVVYSQVASGGQFMSYTIRTDRYRFMEWAEVKKRARPDGLWDLYMDWELSIWPWWTGFFDLKIDPEERYNRTTDPKYSHIQLKLRNKLHKFVDRVYDTPKFFIKGH